MEGRLIMQANLSAGQDRDLSSRIMGRVRLLGCARHNLEAKRLHAMLCEEFVSLLCFLSALCETFFNVFHLGINYKCNIPARTNSNRHENVDASFVRRSN